MGIGFGGGVVWNGAAHAVLGRGLKGVHSNFHFCLMHSYDC